MSEVAEWVGWAAIAVAGVALAAFCVAMLVYCVNLAGKLIAITHWANRGKLWRDGSTFRQRVHSVWVIAMRNAAIGHFSTLCGTTRMIELSYHHPLKWEIIDHWDYVNEDGEYERD